MRAAFAAMDVSPPGLRLSCDNAIPHGRGLGSSAAAIVGGAALARALVVDGETLLDDDSLFRLAAGIEGHPDNVAPALLGGFVISGREGANFFALPSTVDSRISVVVFVPPDPVSTEVARGLLPDQVSHADAAADAGRTALLVAALAQRPEHLFLATRDFLHQDFRRAAMPDSLALVDRLRKDGVAATVSGAGPTVLAFTTARHAAADLLGALPAVVGVPAPRDRPARRAGRVTGPARGSVLPRRPGAGGSLWARQPFRRCTIGAQPFLSLAVETAPDRRSPSGSPGRAGEEAMTRTPTALLPVRH